MSEMIVELPEQATGIRYGWHDRYQIPLDHPSALRFYIDKLFVPHSRREMVWALVARSSALATRAAVPVLRIEAANSSERNSVEEAADAGVEGSTETGDTGIEWLTVKLENHLRRAGVTTSGALSFLSLDDYRHAERQKMVLFIFDHAGTRPCAVAKIGGEERHGAVLAHEHEMMRELHGRVGEELRATMPQPLALFGERGLMIFLESFVGGRSIYFEMRNSWRPRRLAARHFRLASEWIVRFQRATQVRAAQLDEATADEYVVSPLRDFGRAFSLLPEERALVSQVKELTRELGGERLPLVARQGDFWARNLILQGDTIGVVDWEGFREESTPFWDMFLFATSYALSYPWRLGRWAEPSVAFRAAYLEPSWFAQLTRRHLLSHCNAMDVSPRLLEIFFPVFLAERALEEERQTVERVGRKKKQQQNAPVVNRRDATGMTKTAQAAEVGTWRRLFQEYARRTKPACFG
ncbi:MAG TPA: hypothetical protein VF666_03090 [Pyrinomonadaceae bacterium]|jgi:hypothetical protein